MKEPNKKIMLIEGKQADQPSFFFALQGKGYEVAIARNGAGAMKKMKTDPVSVVLLDSVSLHTNGSRIIQSLKTKFDDIPVILIVDAETPNTNPSGADVVLRKPFTLRKLINRIKVFQTPENTEQIVGEGSIRLDTRERIVFVDNRVASLTPKTAALLEILIEHRNETVPRIELFSRVWKTEFLDDMRTLDVHIRWLRESIEKNPKKPVYLKTDRGIGYRLVCDEDKITVI